MAVICPLFSGSSGNSTYIGYSDKGILIDIGVSNKRLVESLQAINVMPESITAVFITHEHIDHVKGLKVFAKKYRAPIYCSEQTKKALVEHGYIEHEDSIISFSETLEIGGFRVTRFDTSHDCPGSSGYTVITPDAKKVGICTDLGCVTETIFEKLSGANLALIESNHDLAMLRSGKYPRELKIRISSDKGHLSNPCCAELVSRLAQSGTSRFLLGHISRENNTPLLAVECATMSLSLCGLEINRDYTLDAALESGNKIVVV